MSVRSRRSFLATLGRAMLASTAAGAIPPWLNAATAPRQASPSGRSAPSAGLPVELIERNAFPEHYETTLEALGHSWITRNDRFFVRSHFAVPEVDPQAWRLEVEGGSVRRPFSISLPELRDLVNLSATHTLECAGNGRGLYALPSTSGTQWQYGAVGTATWGGPRLATLLQRAEIRPDAAHVWFEAADEAPHPDVPRFVRSIPIAKANADALVAITMNEEPLPRLHGAPARIIVPGWYGMASTKWVTRIRVENRPSDNHFMVRG